jgi:pimeloyl-ACP methyl ester carboxylesterase
VPPEVEQHHLPAIVAELAGQGLPGEVVLYSQGQKILKAQGASAEQLDRQRDLQTRLFALVKTETDPDALDRKTRAILDEAAAKLSDEKQKETGSLRYFVAYDPRPALRQVRCPALALVGSMDLQVDPATNLRAIEQALREGGNTDYTVEELPKLNHLFQTCTTGSLAEYAKIEEAVAPVVLEMIADWIAWRTVGGKR